LECGLDPGDKVRDYLATFEPALAVAFDPANFLANSHDPVKAIAALSSLIAHVQARDVRIGQSGGPKETAVGAGDVDWITLMATLDAVGYTGAVVVDREDGAQRAIDAETGMKFLKRFA